MSITSGSRDAEWNATGCVRIVPASIRTSRPSWSQRPMSWSSTATWDGICGRPEIRQRESSLRFVHDEVSLPGSGISDWLDVQPNLNSDAGWIVLLKTGELASFTPRSGEVRVLWQIADPGFELDAETGLCLSPASDFAATFQTSGRIGCVIDLRSGEVTTRLDRGECRPENSHFPIAFFEADGRSLLVSPTEWYRLDIIDPASGSVLTEREADSFYSGDRSWRDYFHGQLVVSPDGRWIADSGWIWSPWGMTRSWSLTDWLEQNPWESESRTSRKLIADRAYYWDGPLCWINNATAAWWGWGADDEWLVPATCLVDVRSGELLRWFPGPEVRRPRAWASKKLAPSLFFDR